MMDTLRALAPLVEDVVVGLAMIGIVGMVATGLLTLWLGLTAAYALWRRFRG